MRLTNARLYLLMTWSLCSLSLFGCSGSETATLPTLAPTAQPTSMPAPASSPTRQLQPTVTRLPPTAATEPTPTTCPYPVQPDLAEAWSRLVLGCPITPGATAVSTAYAPFEGGQMLWRGDTDAIYVLYNDGRWESFPNEWREGDPEFTCGEENPLVTPVRGFGRVWCDHPGVRHSVGAATAAEVGDSAAAVQDFVNGTILTAPFGSSFVLVGEDEVWRRVEE